MKCLFPFDCHFSLKSRENRLTTNGSGVQSEESKPYASGHIQCTDKSFNKNLNKY